MTSMFLLSLSLYCTFSSSPEPFDLLQTHSIFGQLNFLMGDYTVLTDGMPVLPTGENRIPGWDSFATLEVDNPLEAGLWCNGGWCMNFISPRMPDSSFSSRIALLENTAENNRYSAYLRRPIYSELRFDLSIARDDRDKDQILRLSFKEFTTGARVWQNNGSGYALWTAWHPGYADLRLSFSRLYSGGRRVDLLGHGRSNVAGIDAETGFLVSYSKDSTAHAELRLLLRKSLGNTTFMCRGLSGRSDDSLFTGGTVGVISELGAVTIQAGHIYPGNEDVPYTLGVFSFGPVLLSMTLDNIGKLNAGCTVHTDLPFAVIRTSLSSIADTLEFSGIVLPHFDWGTNGRIYGGGSWKYSSVEMGEDKYDLNIISLFTLNTFSFIFGIEEVLEDSRNYTFGIAWGFDDSYALPENTQE